VHGIDVHGIDVHGIDGDAAHATSVLCLRASPFFFTFHFIPFPVSFHITSFVSHVVSSSPFFLFPFSFFFLFFLLALPYFPLLFLPSLFSFLPTACPALT
jgi:hypothetical protein